MAGMYSAKVMEHFAHPHNVGEIPDANGVGEVGNPKCGDIMRMYLKIENNVIVDVKFLTFGCGAAIATSSMELAHKISRYPVVGVCQSPFQCYHFSIMRFRTVSGRPCFSVFIE